MIVMNSGSQLSEMTTISHFNFICICSCVLWMSLSLLVMSCLLITLIKCLKGHKSPGMAFEGVLKMSLSLSLSKMSWSELVTRVGIELSQTHVWTAKKGEKCGLLPHPGGGQRGKWKNGQKHVEILYFPKKRPHGGVWGEDGKIPHFPPFLFIEPFPYSRFIERIQKLSIVLGTSAESLGGSVASSRLPSSSLRSSNWLHELVFMGGPVIFRQRLLSQGGSDIFVN